MFRNHVQMSLMANNAVATPTIAPAELIQLPLLNGKIVTLRTVSLSWSHQGQYILLIKA